MLSVDVVAQFALSALGLVVAEVAVGVYGSASRASRPVSSVVFDGTGQTGRPACIVCGRTSSTVGNC